jgi:multidrug efflux pump subunit AcrA (membrane-fusion protein)
VKVRLEGDTHDVLPGTFGRLYVEESSRPAILVPASAVYRLGQLEVVQVLQNGRAIRRYVRSGSGRDDKVEIISGLKEGDRILVNPRKEV